MASITIAYTAPVAPAIRTANICPTFVPTNAACDDSDFEGTYYDTNVYGFGEGMTLEQFMAAQVAHPGIVAALRVAIADGTYTIDEATADDVLYFGELKSALADQGFEITIA
mgnify:CR=1 FL=1